MSAPAEPPGGLHLSTAGGLAKRESSITGAGHPPALLAWSICGATIIAWAAIRLMIFRDSVMPLTYALPLLICIWTKDKRMLWGMAGVFALSATLKVWWVMPGPALPPFLDWAVYLSQLANISVAGVVVHAIINLRGRLERKNAALAEANARLSEANDEVARQNEALQKTNGELETANEELAAREEEISRQNEELQTQSEELAQQNEELRSQGEELEQQTEELSGQAEELQAANEELVQREEVLQTLLSANHALAGEAEVLSRVCREGLALLGQDVIGGAVMEARGDMLHVHAHFGVKTDGEALVRWPLKQSLARLVMEENRTASLDDLSLRPDLTFPQPSNGTPFRSILAAPLSVAGRQIGAVEFYSSQSRPWTEDQFRLAQWVAGQCSSVLEMIRLRGEARAQAQRLQVAVGAAELGTWTYTFGSNRWELDERAQQMYGIRSAVSAHDEAAMERILVEAEDRAAMWDAVAQACRPEGDGHYDVEYRVRGADGAIRWIRAWGQVEFEGEGANRKPVRMIGASRDITESRRSQAALQRSRDRSELLSRAISALLVAPDPQQVVQRICDEVRAFLGCAVFFNFLLDEQTKRLRFNACGGVDPRIARKVESLELRESLCGTAAGGACRVLEENLSASDDPRSALVRSLGVRVYACHPLLGPNGQVIGTLSFGATDRDAYSGEDLELMRMITDHIAAAMLRCRTEESLKASEARFRSMADAIPQLAWVANADGWITWYNRRWYDYTGTTPQQMEGWGWQSVHDPQTLPAVLEQWKASIATGEPFDMTFPLRGAGGQFRPFLTRVMPMKDDRGKVVQWFGTNTDISEQKRVEAELASAKQLLEAHMENSPLAVIEWGPDMRLTRWSKAAEQIFGWKAEEVRGKRMWDFRWVYEEDANQVKDVSHELEHGVQCFSANRNYCKDGSVVLCHWYNSTLTDQTGQFRSILSLVLDVTEQHRTQQALVEAKSEAEAANRAKDQFLAVLSHELRTPLNPALMAATILEKSPQLSPDLREDVGIIRRNVELEARLIDDMLDLTRIARGKLTLNRRIVDGCEVLRHAVQTCHAEAAENELDLEVSMPEGPVWVDADSARMQQVYWNLLKNAIKFTPDHGRITVTASATERGGLRVQVSDTGKGIEKEALGRIFDAFEQGSSVITKRYGGLGLGLAICKGLVEMHDGTIRALSDGPGKGSTFVVELPPPGRQQDSPATETSAESPAGEGPAATGCRILLVEDHESTAVMTARLLRSFGHEVTTANCLKCALQKFDEERFDLVVSDLGLPDGTGQELIRQLLTRCPVKGIALSGYGMENDIQQSIEAGFLEHLVKPINAQQLEDAINRVLGR